jgi:hypothetical protein
MGYPWIVKKPIWERKNPRRRHQKMDDSERAAAKWAARKHGRARPSLVDNINARSKNR